jgi:hypothetical protein
LRRPRPKTGVLDPERGLGVPALGFAVVLPVVTIIGVFFAVPSIRVQIVAAPLPALVAVCMLGFSFIALYAQRRLPSPFALSAG